MSIKLRQPNAGERVRIERDAAADLSTSQIFFLAHSSKAHKADVRLPALTAASWYYAAQVALAAAAAARKLSDTAQISPN